MSMRRLIAVLKNDRKFQRVFLCFTTEIDAFLFSGPEQFLKIFQRRASHPLPLREHRFFNADSIDVDASIDRGAQKSSKISTRTRSTTPSIRPPVLPAESLFFPIPSFLSPSSSLLSSPSFSPYRFSKDKFRRALDTREKLVILIYFCICLLVF